MNRAVFLDRDGVINRKGGSYYVFREEDFVLNEGVTDALKYFESKGYLLIIVTNQGGIARGVFTVEQLENLNSYMTGILKSSGITLSGIFYCPHHPEVSACECRKPGTLLFEISVKEYDIDPGKSFMIGDSQSDMIAAERMGIKGILLTVNGNMMQEIVLAGKI